MHPEKVAARAEPVVQSLSEKIPAVPEQTEQAVRINGAVQLVAGSLLALGRLPRLSALALSATLIPTTAAGHAFWATDDKQERAQQRIHFLKNAAMLGGLLIAAADTGGDPSLAWRGRHAVQSARHDASLAAKTARKSGRAGVKVGRASARADRLTGNKSQLTDAVSQFTDKASERGRKVASRAGDLGGQLTDRASDLGGQLADRASDLGGQLADRAGDLGGQLADRLPGQ